MTSSVKEEEEKEKEYDGEYQRQHINRRQMTLSALVSTTLAFVSTTVSTESAFAAVTKSSLTDEEVYDLQIRRCGCLQPTRLYESQRGFDETD